MAKLTGKLVEEGGALKEEITPQTEGVFTTIQLEGASCGLKEPFDVTGTQICELPGIGTEAIHHETECKTTGSKLVVGGKAATYEGTTVGHLEAEPKWSGF